MRPVWPEHDPTPGSWQSRRDELLAEGERRVDPLRKLSVGALATIGALHAAGGRMLFDDLFGELCLVPGFDDGLVELRARKLIASSWAINERGDEAEVLVSLRYEAKL